VVSMLSVGGCCLFGFIFVEFKVAELPMMPRTYIPPSLIPSTTTFPYQSVY
jgi:hypothetical protein